MQEYPEGVAHMRRSDNIDDRRGESPWMSVARKTGDVAIDLGRGAASGFNNYKTALMGAAAEDPPNELENDAGLGDLQRDTISFGDMTPEQEIDKEALKAALHESRKMFGLVPDDEGAGGDEGASEQEFAEGGSVEEDEEAIPLVEESAPAVQGDAGYDDLREPEVGTAEVKPGAYPDTGEDAPAIDMEEEPPAPSRRGVRLAEMRRERGIQDAPAAEAAPRDPSSWQERGPAGWVADKVRAYLRGEGAAPVEEVSAAVQKTGSPEAAVTAAVKESPVKGAAYVQTFRTQFDANRKQAVEALAEGEFQNAAVAASRMMHAAPNGDAVSFSVRGGQFLAHTKDGSIAITPQEFARVIRHSNFDHVMQDAKAIVQGRTPLHQQRAQAPKPAGPQPGMLRVPPHLEQLGITPALFTAGWKVFPLGSQEQKRMDWMLGQLQQKTSNEIAREKAQVPVATTVYKEEAKDKRHGVDTEIKREQGGRRLDQGDVKIRNQADQFGRREDRVREQFDESERNKTRRSGMAAGKTPKEIEQLTKQWHSERAAGRPPRREVVDPNTGRKIVVEFGADGRWRPVRQ